MRHASTRPRGRPRGRPQKEPTSGLTITLPNSVYDRYLQHARHCRVSVRRLIRAILTQHAPRGTMVVTTGTAHETSGQQPLKW